MMTSRRFSRLRPRVCFLGLATAVSLPLLLALGCGGRTPEVGIGSKEFPESEILGSMASLLVKNAGKTPHHYAKLGDTAVVWNALLNGTIDVYCEYTGTLTHELLASEHLENDEALRRYLEGRGLRMSRSLGFSDNYALGMTRQRATQLNVRTISDLKKHPELRFGLSIPFLERADGWKGLRKAYGLPQEGGKGIEHYLAYQSLRQGEIDVTDLYSTDAKIREYDLLVLDDDRHYFPAYQAVLLYRADLEERAPEVVQSLRRLEGKVSEADMIDLNAKVEIDGEDPGMVAAGFLSKALGVFEEPEVEALPRRLLSRTIEHVEMVALSLLPAILVAIPLGIVAARRARLGQVILASVGVVQTMPALALLLLLLWLLGGRIGLLPAVIALFLYSLLPIVRNTFAGLHDVPLHVRESAEALGLTPFAQLYLVELPLASRAILAGIKTAAVINVGYATLGGLIGAGGYGVPIKTGINYGRPAIALEGAIPAILLALLVQGLFELAERFLVPRGLRLKPVE
jgi:osmoprotectant transport system permease protein